MCYFTLKQHSATEVYLPKEWKGKRRMTWIQDGWAAWGLKIMEQCSYKPVQFYYLPQCVSIGVAGMGFSSVISFCLKLLSQPLGDEKWIWLRTDEWNERKLKESEGDSTCFSLPWLKPVPPTMPQGDIFIVPRGWWQLPWSSITKRSHCSTSALKFVEPLE